MYEAFRKSLNDVFLPMVKEMATYCYPPSIHTFDNAVEALRERFVEAFVEKSKGHFTMMFNWARENYAFYFLTPIDNTKLTINLDVSRADKKHHSFFERMDGAKEIDNLSKDNNLIIFGDPGSGKTTIIKKIIYTSFMSEDHKGFGHFYFPILLLCRDIKHNLPIEVIIADHLAINYEARPFRVQNQVGPQGEIEEYTITKYYFRNVELSDFIIALFNDHKVLLLIEGLDEYKYINIGPFMSGIEEIAGKMNGGRILITCRAAFLPRTFQFFHQLWVCALSEPQIKSLVELFVIDSAPFLEDLTQKSYADIADRPLFLTYLILIYERSGQEQKSLPESSKEVYETVVDYFLSRWDEERGAGKRRTKYSTFSAIKKREFLSQLSFLLTYKIKSVVFSSAELEIAYGLLAEQYGLPTDQAFEVAKEIESHTGIISKSFGGKYEFSHLSIQEYLCANYFLKAFNSDAQVDYFREYPAPLAVSVSLSMESTTSLINLIKYAILTQDDHAAFFTTSSKIVFGRLVSENPYFKMSKDLGYAILYLCDRCDCNDVEFAEVLNKFVVRFENVRISIHKALDEFSKFSTFPVASKIRVKRKPIPDDSTTSIIAAGEYGSLPLTTYHIVTGK